MRPIDVVRRLCPRGRAEYLAAFEAGDAAIAAAAITTPKHLAHALAQMFHESDGLTITEESGNYSPARMMEVWPGRFPTLASAAPYAHNAEKLFNHVYANRMGNGDEASGDGYRYRGRGLLQTTGREAYREYGRRCGADFEDNPGLILSAQYALAPALAEWKDGGCSAMADRDDIRGITRKINGGLTGLESRINWLQRVKAEIVRLGAGLPPPPAPIGSSDIVPASVISDEDVQRALNDLGFGPLTVDGDIGPASRAAVKRFQLGNGLLADGTPGPRTKAALAAALNAKH